MCGSQWQPNTAPENSKGFWCRQPRHLESHPVENLAESSGAVRIYLDGDSFLSTLFSACKPHQDAWFAAQFWAYSIYDVSYAFPPFWT